MGGGSATGYSFLLLPMATTGYLGYNRAFYLSVQCSSGKAQLKSVPGLRIALRKDVSNLKESGEFNMIKYDP